MQSLMAGRRIISRRRFMAVTLMAAAAPTPLLAVTSLKQTPRLQGTTAGGQLVRLEDLRGRVVLVLYWSTGCAVCRDKMRELRANLAGWQSQPFTLLGVNMDTRQKDFADYEALVQQAVPPAQRFTSLWAGASGFSDSMGRPEQLPSGCLVDKEGRLVERYSGRIPAEAWDRIAELM